MGARVDPVVPSEDSAKCVKTIVDRRNAAVLDDRLEEVTEDPFALVGLVAKDPHPADIVPALTVVTYLRRELDEHEGTLLAAGRDAGLSLRELGAPLGLDTRQAVRARMRASLARAAQARTLQPDEPPTPTAAQWVDAHGQRLEEAARALLRCRTELVGEDIEGDLDDLEMSLHSVPSQRGRLRVKRLGLVSTRLRLLREDVTETTTARARAALEEAALLALDHRSTI